MSRLAKLPLAVKLSLGFASLMSLSALLLCANHLLAFWTSLSLTGLILLLLCAILLGAFWCRLIVLNWRAAQRQTVSDWLWPY